MKRKNTTRNALFTSIISMLLCVSMLVGATFAWFTDEVKSGTNVIAAGNLDIDVMYANTPDGTYTSIENVADLFVAPIGATKGLWEPGHTEVAYLKVVNNGTLALKYQFMVDAASEVIGKSVLGNDIKLSEILKFAATEPRETAPAEYDRATAQAAAEAANGNLLGYTTETKTLAPGAAHYIALVVYMPETTGNEANYRGDAVPTINFKLTALATQVEAESDSFGDDYDKDAWADGMKVYSEADLNAALANGETNIVLMDDIELTGPIVIPASATTYALRSSGVTINLNGKTLSNPNDYVIENYGNVTITGNGTVSGMGGIRSHSGSVVINGGNYYASSDWNDGNYQHTLKAVNSNVVINGGNFDATVNGQTNAMFNAGENGQFTINGGTFKNVEGDLIQFSPYIFTYEKNGKVIINDGTFYGGWRFNGETATTDIYGGTFTVGFDGQSFHANSTHVVTVYGGTFVSATNAALTNKLTELVADDYKAVEVDGTYYVVADNVAGVVTKPENLKDALTSAGAAGAGNTTIAFFGNIDMTGVAWTPIKVDGYHGADIVTIEGNGATITGLTAPLFAGGFAGGSGIVIKDLTIADSNIVSTNTIGSGAFIESVDSMALITLDNCHLVNSTVTGGNGSRTGGLIGWTAGYNNVNDGPVKTYVNITNCSVVGCTITCDGSVGGIYGHAGNNAWTYSTVENCVVKDNVLNSTDDGGWRVGVVVGTANVGELTIKNITESGNTLTQTGKTAPAGQSNLYGRFVPGTTGKLEIDGKTAATNTAGVNNALNNGEDVVLMGDVNVSASEAGSNGYGATGVNVSGSTLDGNGNSLGVNKWGTWDSAINITGGAIKNLTINSGMRGIFMGSATADVYIDNVIIDGTIYTFNSDGGNKNYGVYISNSTLNGWTSHSDVHKEVVYTNCNFGEGNGYAFCRPYGKTVLENCVFEEGFEFDTSKTSDITFIGCYYGDTLITAENAAALGNGETTFFYNGLNGITIQ